MVKPVEIVELLGFDGAGGLRKRTVASGAVIAVGDLLNFSDPNTVSVNSTSGAAFGGIAKDEKRGDGEDFTTQITVYTDVIGDVRASGAIGFGNAVMLDENPNYVKQANASLKVASGALVAGVAEEAATDDEVVRVHFTAH